MVIKKLICEDMPFEKGNQEAKKGKKAYAFRSALNVAVKEAHGDGNKLRGIAERLVEAALDGDIQAIKEVADRLDGKPKQQSEISGPDGGAIPIGEVVFKVHDPSTKED